MKYFLDTNIFLRFLVADDMHTHEACKKLFQLIEVKRINAVTSLIVFAEIVWVLQSFYKFPRAKISEVLKVLTKNGIAIDNRCNILIALEWYELYTIKFVDSLIASHPFLHQGSLALISYDKDFDRLNVRRMEPQEVINKAGRK